MRVHGSQLPRSTTRDTRSCFIVNTVAQTITRDKEQGGTGELGIKTC